jgi:hypothetical protein
MKIKDDTPQPTDRGRYFVGDHIHYPLPYLTTVKPFERFSCDVEQEPALSIAVTLVETPVTVLVRFQHEPQVGEFHTTSNTPTIKGKEGISPKVGNCAESPFEQSEHGTMFSEPLFCHMKCRRWRAELMTACWTPDCCPFRALMVAGRT